MSTTSVLVGDVSTTPARSLSTIFAARSLLAMGEIFISGWEYALLGENPYQSGWNPWPFSLHHPPLPFLATLEFLEVSKLTNEPIHDQLYWLPIPTKIPAYCPNFEGKFGEDPHAHFMTYHLWCSSNSWVDYSIRIRIFPRTLTGVANKWYIELPWGVFFNFNILAMAFLTHF